MLRLTETHQSAKVGLHLEEIMAKCAGCSKDHTACGYDEHDRVEDDGSYADGKFVCDECYIKLVGANADIGTPEVIQENARILIGEKP